MPRKRIASIGVDFCARDVRAVEVSSDGRSIVRYASALLPSIGLDNGLPTDPDFIAVALRSLIRELNPSSRPAVLGLPASAVTTRVLDVPQVPEAELKSILDGEVQHFGIVRGFGGMFDFVRLAPSSREDSDPQALVMACEAVQLNALRDGAERAKVDKAAIEPSLLGLIRCAAIHEDGSEPAALIALSGDIAEIAIVEDQRLKLYRRLELAAEDAGDSFLKGMAADVPAFVQAESEHAVLGQLTVETRRTLDYVKRISDGPAPAKIILAVSEPADAAIAGPLAEALGAKVEIAKAPLPSDDGIKFAAAYGLAAGSAFADTAIPQFDLSPFDPVAAEAERRERAMAMSMVASIIAILGCVSLAFWIGLKANRVEHELAHLKDESNQIQEVTLPEAMARQRRLEEYEALSARGIPVPRIVDSLTDALDLNSGLTEIAIDGAQMKIAGESKDEASMIQTLDQLRGRRGFTNTFIESFDQDALADRKVVRFHMATTLGEKPAVPTVGGKPTQ